MLRRRLSGSQRVGTIHDQKLRAHPPAHLSVLRLFRARYGLGVDAIDPDRAPNAVLVLKVGESANSERAMRTRPQDFHRLVLNGH